MAEFYHRSPDHDLYRPTYGGVDWHSLAQHPETVEPVYFRTDDGLDLQLTQENAGIYFSRCNDDIDAITVLDPRDRQRFAFFRNTLGEHFNPLSHTLQAMGACAVTVTLYPQEWLVNKWMEIHQATEDFIPDDWLDTPS